MNHVQELPRLGVHDQLPRWIGRTRAEQACEDMGTTMKLFTLDQARALLPSVRVAMREMQARKAEFDQHRAALSVLAPRSAGEGEHLQAAVARHRAAAERLAEEIQGLVAGVLALGVEVKGIDQGLIDFPAEREGRVVYLCWMLDEPDIAWWHDLQTGFQGRRPLERDEG